MIIKKEDLSHDAYITILRENITRGADQFEGDMEYNIKKADRMVTSGELVIVFSQTKNDVTLVPKENFGK